MATKKEMQTKDESELAMYESDRPSWIPEDGDKGNDNVGIEDIALPRIDVLQALSPQISKRDPAYVDGADQGVFINTVTEELYGDSFLFVPVFFRKEWIIWKDRKKGGGFFGSFDSEQAAAAAVPGLEGDPSDYEVNETHNHFILVVNKATTRDDVVVEEAVVSMARSKLSVSRTLNSMIRLRQGNRYSSIFRMEAIEKANPAGEKYWSMKPKMLGYCTELLYKRAEATYDAIAAGERSVNYESADTEADAGSKPATAREF